MTSNAPILLHFSQSDLDQALGALRTLGLIDDHPRNRPLIILGPNVPFGDRVFPPPPVHPGGDASLDNYSGPTTEFTTGVPYPCRNCKAMNKPVDPKRWYAVIRGLQVGVFEEWATVQPLVNLPGEPGFMLPGAHSESFRTRQEAEARFTRAIGDGDVARLDMPVAGAVAAGAA